MGEKFENYLNKIIRNNVSFIPAFWIDKQCIFTDVLNNINFNSDIDFIFLKAASRIQIQRKIKKAKIDKKTVFYTVNDLEIDAYIAAGKASLLNIDINDFFSVSEVLYSKVKNKIYLSNEQFKLFIDRFEDIYELMLKEEFIDEDVIKNIILKSSIAKSDNSKDIIIKVLKNNFDIGLINDANLLDNLIMSFKNILGIDVDSDFITNDKLLLKILLTLTKNDLKEDYPSIFEDMVINVSDITLAKLFEFIKCNNENFENELENLNKYVINNIDLIRTEHISYIIPCIFEKTVGNRLKKNLKINIDNKKLWTKEMKIVGDYFKKYDNLEQLLNKNINYYFCDTDMNSYIEAYKKELYLIDNLYRNLSADFDVMSTCSMGLFNTICNTGMFKEISDKYYNVILNINSKYIGNYNILTSNRGKSFSQSEVFKNIKINDNTVILFADGLRYEMAKELINELNTEENIDYNVFSEIPSETELCMNSYFITDEKVRINDKCIFELIKDKKIITDLKSWRLSKAKQILNKEVIDFETFKNNLDYKGIVLCFDRTVDNYIHKFTSASKVSSAIDDIKLLIQYSINRKFDVLLLSDHGFIEAEEKIREQDKNVPLEKKKGRYLILNKKTKCDNSFYIDNYKCADFIDTNGYKICFINSMNTLKKVNRYIHGGISLQENIIPAFLIKCKINSEKVIINPIKNLSAVNEIKADIVNVSGTTLVIYHKGKQVYKVKINSDNYNINYSIRYAACGEEFLIIILKNDTEIHREIIIKQGRTVIDKDLDIFGGR